MITVEINYQVRVPQKFETLFAKVGRLISRKLKVRDRLEVSVAFISPQKIRQLNKRYRGKDKITDVLSFPEINEIVICYPKAASQARKQKQSLKKQLAWLFCHGLLHLLGYSHQTKKDEEVMKAIELGVLEKL